LQVSSAQVCSGQLSSGRLSYHCSSPFPVASLALSSLSEGFTYADPV
jgi:hypothetical protein